MRDDPAELQFSNAVLEGYLQYATAFEGGARYPDFLAQVGKDESWLNDKSAWHTATFLEHFYRCLSSVFPETDDIAFEGARYLYKQKRFQRFTSIAGLLLKPEIMFSALPEAVSRMNLYNAYEFKITSKKLGITTGLLIQRYDNPQLKVLNRCLCQAAQGSTVGAFEYMGHELIELRERKCVNQGHDQCEFELAWINRPYISNLLGWVGLAAVSVATLTLLQMPWPLTALNSLLFPSAVVALIHGYRSRRYMRNAFAFQQELFHQLRDTYSQTEQLNRKLIRYQQQLSDANTLACIGESSFGVFHDMATPAAIIELSTEAMNRALEHGELNRESLAGLCRMVERGSNRISKMIRQYRDVARGIHRTPIDVELTASIRDNLELLCPLLDRHSIRVVTHLPETEVHVRNFDGYVEAILLNLVRNSCSAMQDANERTLTIRLEESPDSVLITIADTGPGIPEEIRAHIWERFKHVGRDGGGSGYGLYSVKTMVEHFGGDIDIHDRPRPERGTLIAIRLPRDISEDILASDTDSPPENAYSAVTE